MTPKLARALLVIAAFGLVASVTVAEQFLVVQGAAPPPPPTSVGKPFSVLFWSSFKYFLAWALVAPGIFWLSRVVPVVQRRWWRPVVFHVLVPAAASIPFFTFRLLLNAALAMSVPPLHVVSSNWWKILSMETIAIAPTYWVLVAAGSVVQFVREDEARQMRTIELRRALSAAQLDGLRMKLQPHFLFNTLNAIASLAQQGDTDDVVEMVDHLGTLLRLSMETSGRQMVTLDEELQLLEAYLAIEEVRFRDRLIIERRIAPDVGPTPVPNLILQPLVENAIVHGLSRRIDATKLRIAARRAGDRVDVSVQDDGPGLPTGWSLASGAGRGLGNVAERLAALYGGAAQLLVEDAAGGGTIARLLLPLAPASPQAGGS